MLLVWLGMLTHSVAAFGSEDQQPTLDIHGFVSQGFLKSEGNNIYADTKDGTFQFNEFGINFRTELTDRLSVGLQLFARDLGDLGNDDLAIDWAYGNYQWKEWLGIRAGKIKIPFGLYNQIRDLDMLRTSIFLPSGLYDEKNRDVFLANQGINVYGNMGLHQLGSLSYQVQVGEFQTNEGNKYRKDDFNARSLTLDADTLYAGSLEWETPVDGLRLGASILQFAMNMSVTIGDDGIWQGVEIPAGTVFSIKMKEMRNWIVSAEYTLGDVIVFAEYNRWAHNNSESEMPGMQGHLREILNEEAYYVSVVYRVTSWLECGTYYSVERSDESNTPGGNTGEEDQNDRDSQEDFALTTRIDFNEHWTFKLEGHAINGTTSISPTDNPNGIEEDSFLFAAKVTFNF